MRDIAQYESEKDADEIDIWTTHSTVEKSKERTQSIGQGETKLDAWTMHSTVGRSGKRTQSFGQGETKSNTEDVKIDSDIE